MAMPAPAGTLRRSRRGSTPHSPKHRIIAFGEPHRAFGEGGSIPFMGMLGERFPEAQFVVTGALGPDSNAHGPNEYLDVPTARKLTRCVAHLLHAHATR